MNKISTLVVTYNRKELLKECIESLINQTYKEFDIIIIDNASTDGTEELVKQYSLQNENIIYINTGKNLGGAGGFNYGIKQAILKGYEYCLIMDDDTITLDNTLFTFIEKAKKLNYKFSFMSSIVKWTDNSICKMNGVEINENWISDFEKIKEGMIPIKSASFVSCFVNLNLCKKIGLPIKEFFIYGDDVEYTLRLSKEENAYLVLDSEVIHKMKTNENTDITTFDSSRIDRMFYKYRNRFYISKKQGIKATIKYIVRYFIEIINVLIKAKDSKLKRIIYMTKGMIYGIFFNPKIEKI